MENSTQRFAIRVTMDRGEGDTLEVSAATAWSSEQGKADAPWCFAMKVKEVLEALEIHMDGEEWEQFVCGLKTIGDE
jgi:hypothetical protein